MLPFVVFFIEGINNNFQVFLFAKEIGIGCIHKQRFDVVLLDILGIRFLQREQVIVGDRLFVFPVAFFNILLQFFHGRMQVNEYVGLHNLRVDDFKQFLVQAEFFFGQIYFGKQQALGEQVIRNGDVLEHVFRLQQVFQLLITFGHEEQFQRKGILAGVFIKLWEKGIVGELFQDKPGIEMFAE